MQNKKRIAIPTEHYEILKEEAQKRGLTIDDYADEIIRGIF